MFGSDLFDADTYRDAYLRGSAVRAVAFAHYLLIGERRGYRPNPFFDPAHYRKALANNGVRPKQPLLAYYRRDGARRKESPSAEFEHDWYAWQNPDWSVRHEHPMGHYLDVGLADERDPSPFIDMRRYLQGLGVGASAAMRALAQQIRRSGGASGPGTIRDFAALRARQAAFRATLNFEVLRRGPARRRHLVFLQSAPGVERRYLRARRSFDLLRNYYDDPSGAICDVSEHVLFQRGTKTTAIEAILERDPGLLLAYDNVLFLDDDIDLDAPSIDRLFEVMTERGLVVAQPLLTPDSPCVWPVFKSPEHTGKVVPVSSVEVMMPAFSREALQALAWTFGEAISGFGVDMLWGAFLPEARARGCIAIVGEARATHEKKIDEVGGAFYRFLGDSGINPKLELWRIVQEHGIKPEFTAINASPKDSAQSASKLSNRRRDAP